ncbi:MAG TPA: DUF4276 family protein [Bacteroidales bacterium]|nr:DUF4276 family protein [Bacteroidales bacterium]HPS17346.1 DUF4276 family protein [Bacteroidales bacterium]
MNPIPLNLVFEDQISEFVMRKLAAICDDKFFISYSYYEEGFGYIKKNIDGFNEASKGCAFFVLTDLDKTDCAPTLIKNWLNKKVHNNLIFRVAVREVEAWLLADIEGFSEYTGISIANFYDNPEKIDDPKIELFRLIKKCRKREIREDILPKDEYAKIGPNYNERLGEFVFKYWNVERAAKRSISLKKALSHLSRFDYI